MTALDAQTGQDVLCPTCCKGRMHPRRVTERFPYEVDGETTLVVAENVPVHVCEKCGEQLSGPEAARLRHEAICRALGLLTPAEIRSIRERLGLTQKQFTRMTRIGEATICRWESGRLLQNPAMDRYLRLMAASEDNVRFLRGLNQEAALGTPAVPRREAERLANDLGFRLYREAPMDKRVAQLKTPDECEQFALNVQAHEPDLARAARRRAVELQAQAHGAKSAAEQKALEAVYAYERVLSQKHGKKVRAGYTWRMIKRRGIIDAVERAVSRRHDPAGYTALAAMGMQDLSFEAVVVQHPEVFSKDAVSRSTERLREWASAHPKSPA